MLRQHRGSSSGSSSSGGTGARQRGPAASAAPNATVFAERVRTGTHSARACLLSRHASKGIGLPAQAMRARPCWEGRGGPASRGLSLQPRCVALRPHTGMPPVSRCRFPHRWPMRDLLRGSRASPADGSCIGAEGASLWGYFLRALRPGGTGLLCSNLYLACPSVGLAPIRAVREGRA